MIQEWASINDVEIALRALEVQESHSAAIMAKQAEE